MSGLVCPDCSAVSLGLRGRGLHLVIPSVVLPILAALLVFNRLYWRLRMLGRLGWDDFSTILATVFLTVQCGASITAVNFGYGRQLNTLNQHQASRALMCFFLVQIFYKLTINCTKLSVLFLYLRIFTERPWFVRICWSLVLCVLFAGICFTTATLLQCTPIESAWNHWSVGRSCVNIYALWYSNAVYNILTDFIIILMVPPLIFKLKLPIRQKMALIGVFGLGTIVCAASISRLTTLYSSAYGEDATAGSLISTIWTTIEAGLGIICANLPMLRTPLQHFFPRLFPSRPGTNRYSTRSVSLPCDASNNARLVPLATGSQAPFYPLAEVTTAQMEQTLNTTFNTVDDNVQLHEETYWRPCLDALPESYGYETQIPHDVHSSRVQVAEEDWYQCQHKVW